VVAIVVAIMLQTIICGKRRVKMANAAVIMVVVPLQRLLKLLYCNHKIIVVDRNLKLSFEYLWMSIIHIKNQILMLNFSFLHI
jgi:hypothetical protein